MNVLVVDDALELSKRSLLIFIYYSDTFNPIPNEMYAI